MKIALIGYGKMGHAIERQALLRGHDIVAKVDTDTPVQIDSEAFRSAEVAIEFTSPASAYENCRKAIAEGVAVVSGSTGWLDKLPELKKFMEEREGTLFYSSNYSIGMNIFMMTNEYLARLMKEFPQYKPSMEETHHIHKLDHPSGSAVTLANAILEHSPSLTGWEAQIDKESAEDASKLHINCHRVGEVPGIHTIKWESPVDTITITHDAKSREGFALGAVIAAEWVAGKKGYYEMNQLMHDIINGNKSKA